MAGARARVRGAAVVERKRPAPDLAGQSRGQAVELAVQPAGEQAGRSSSKIPIVSRISMAAFVLVLCRMATACTAEAATVRRRGSRPAG